MPWKESRLVNERMRFVIRFEDGERMTDLCREFSISRKTGYKFVDRYRRFGAKGLFDESRKPLHSPSKTKAEVIRLLVSLKKDKPTWGAPKLQHYLKIKHPNVHIPSVPTIHSYLDRHGLVKKRRYRAKTQGLLPEKVAVSNGPNQLWCADFKGQFQLGNRRYCYPLTITDHFSRFLVCCEGLEDTKSDPAKAVFEAVFREFGLPDRMRTDNGCPFASTGLFGLSRLSVWWMKLGIKIERIEPGCPEQNGRHERMHRTLKQATTRPAGKNFLEQQQRFDEFQQDYNCERPHEALGMKTPASLYEASPKRLLTVTEPTYPLHDFSTEVRSNGAIYIKKMQHSFYLSHSFAGEQV